MTRRCFNCDKRIWFVKNILRLLFNKKIKVNAEYFVAGYYKGEIEFCSNNCAANYLEENNVWTNHPIKIGLVNYH